MSLESSPYLSVRILALEDRRVEVSTAVGGEAVLNDGFDAVTEVHFCWAVVACTLRKCRLEDETRCSP
jgi:hypothetical protein